MSNTAVSIRPIKKGSVAKLWIGLGGLALAAAGVAYAGTAETVAKSSPEAFLAYNGKKDGVVTTASGVQYRVVEAGAGRQIGPNDGVIVEYEGRLIDGTVFDSTKGKGPAPMLVGQVVPGFGEALQQMQPGGSYRIWIPPALAYGSTPPPGAPIPPDAVLDFDVKVLQVVPDAALQMGPGGPAGHM